MLTFFDFRNDVRAVIKSLCFKHNVVLFIRKEHEELIKPYLIPGLSYRLIVEEQKSFPNYVFSRLFLFLKRIPQSKQNYYLMEEFKINNLKTPKQQRKAKIVLHFKKLLPNFITYDLYLSRLTYKNGTDISGIDKFIAFTEIYDDYLFARLLKEKKPLTVYVYSWDHPCKHVRFSNQVNYLVWNDGMAADLQQLQGIDNENIKILGASQLGYIAEFLKSTPPKPEQPYFFFGCGIGIENLVPEEIKIIETLSDSIQEIYPNHKLFVRPYPNLKNWAIYEQLLKKANIELDNSYKQSDLSVSDADIMIKFNKINGAKAFFHLGTTLGLEACFTKCPSFLLDIHYEQNRKSALHHFIHQYQNEKYLIANAKENFITSKAMLNKTLQELSSNTYHLFNQAVVKQYPILSFESIANRLTEI